MTKDLAYVAASVKNLARCILPQMPWLIRLYSSPPTVLREARTGSSEPRIPTECRATFSISPTRSQVALCQRMHVVMRRLVHEALLCQRMQVAVQRMTRMGLSGMSTAADRCTDLQTCRLQQTRETVSAWLPWPAGTQITPTPHQLFRTNRGTALQ